MDNIIKFFEQAQPIIAFIGAALSVAVLGFIIKLTQLSKAASQDQIKAIEEQKKIIEEQKKVIEERLKNSEADLLRTQKWHEQEKSELKAKLSELMDSPNNSLEKLFENGLFENIENEIKIKITSILSEMRKIDVVSESRESSSPEDPQWFIEMAKGYTATNNWRLAAEYYGKYLEIKQSDWQVHFYQGVAYQNAREGGQTDFLASRAYSNAVLWMPDNLERNFKSRIYTYKGASLKRLKRLDESEAYLLLGEKYAAKEYEIYDNKYNLACVYSMKRKRKELFAKLVELSENPKYLYSVTAHLEDYFANYADDPEFLELIR